MPVGQFGAGFLRRHGARSTRLGHENDAATLAGKFQRRAAALPRVAAKALDEAAAKYWAFSRTALDKGGAGGAVYANPVPVSRTGRPKWNRTGDLLKLEMPPEKRAENIRVIRNEAQHGIVRHEMPESLHKQGKDWAHGDRTVHWRLIAEEKLRKAGGLAGPLQIEIRHIFQTT